MSISAIMHSKYTKVAEKSGKDERIRSQVLSLFSDSRLKGKVVVPTLDFTQIEIVFIDFKQSVKVNFQDNFPFTPPKFKRQKSFFQSLVTQSNSLDSWTYQSHLSDVVFDVYENLKNCIFTHTKLERSQFNIQNEEYYKRKNSKESSQQTKRKVMMNGCADNELTETKNLNRHFRSKLRQVYFDIIKQGVQPPEDARWIESSFTLPRVGFQDIAKVLKNQWFNLEVNKQMENGRFMHKIMKGMMSIKSKKLMVKYYHVMLAAAKDPQNFVKWKYQ